MRLVFESRRPISLAVDALGGGVRLQRLATGQVGLLRVRRRGRRVLMWLDGPAVLDCTDFSADLLARTVQALRSSRCVSRMRLHGAFRGAETVSVDILETHLQDVLRQRWGLSPAQALLMAHKAKPPADAQADIDPDGRSDEP